MKTKTKHGQHDESLVGFSTYITPELKAIVQVTANEANTDMVEIQRRGFIEQAIRLGVVDAQGRVTQKYRAAVDAYVDVYLTKKANRKSTRK